MLTPKTPRGQRTNGHRQSSSIDLTDGTPGPTGDVKVQRPSPTPNSNSSSASTVSSTTGSIFDEGALEAPSTPLTPPMDDNLELAGAKINPFEAGSFSIPSDQELALAIRKTPPKKRRSSAKPRVQRATGSPAVRSRRQPRAVSLTERVETAGFEGTATSQLLSPPSISRERACSEPAAPNTHQCRLEQVEGSNANEFHPPMPGAFGSQTSDAELQNEDLTPEDMPNIASDPTGDGIQSRSATPLERSESDTDTPNERGWRPTFEVYRSVNETRPPTKSETDGRILNLLREKLKSKAKDEENVARTPFAQDHGTGWVYAYESALCKNHIKIGMSRHHPVKRLSQWTSCCKMDLWTVEDLQQAAFDHCQLVERLVQIELHKYRRTLRCRFRPITHIEWYEIEKAEAMKYIAKWRRWIVLNSPFDAAGILTPYWGWRVEALSKGFDSLDWETWTLPPWYDYWIVYHWDVFSTQYCPGLQNHLKRKDNRFVTHGIITLLMVYILAGRAAVAWGFLALIAL